MNVKKRKKFKCVYRCENCGEEVMSLFHCYFTSVCCFKSSFKAVGQVTPLDYNIILYIFQLPAIKQ